MGGLIVGDLLKVLIEGLVVASFREVGLGEVGETFAVELVFEMFEGQGIVKDVRISVSCLPLFNGSGGRRAGESERSGDAGGDLYLNGVFVWRVGEFDGRLKL